MNIFIFENIKLDKGGNALRHVITLHQEDGFGPSEPSPLTQEAAKQQGMIWLKENEDVGKEYYIFVCHDAGAELVELTQKTEMLVTALGTALTGSHQCVEI